jgi:hypothetical protein
VRSHKESRLQLPEDQPSGFVTTEVAACYVGSKVGQNNSAYSKTENHGHENSTSVLLFADRKPLVNCFPPKKPANDSDPRTNGKADAKRTLVVGDSEHPVNHDGCDWNRIPNAVPEPTVKHIPNAAED